MLKDFLQEWRKKARQLVAQLCQRKKETGKNSAAAIKFAKCGSPTENHQSTQIDGKMCATDDDGHLLQQ